MQTNDLRDAELRWHALTGEQAVQHLESHAERGLEPGEVAPRRARYGSNELPAAARRSLLATYVDQLKSPLIYLLLAASLIALVLGHHSDAVVIAIVVLLNAVIGAYQEGRAERALEALRRLTIGRARVVRAGSTLELPARELVPGDVLLVEGGEAVPADARLLEAVALQATEAALTGEALPVAKHARVLDRETPMVERSNMLFTGTYVTAGRGRALVVATGAATEVGAIASLAQSARSGPTPLEQRVARFGHATVKVAAALFVLVVALGLLRGMALADIAMLAVSQVVGMIPEGLPVAMTIALATGVQRMARRNVVVRRLTAVETLGSTTVICTDKTGTLTRNEMMVTAIVTASGRSIEVNGDGYSPAGTLIEEGAPTCVDDELRVLLNAAALCNDAHIRLEGDAVVTLGDPTEIALLAVAMKGGVQPEAARASRPRVREVPFDPVAKLMATEHGGEAGPTVLLKGAPEEVFALANDAALQAQADRLAGAGLRVLAFAHADRAVLDERGFEGLRGQLRVLGLLAQTDPLRAEVPEAMRRCRDSGVRPVMVTGDHKRTARAIAVQMGMAEHEVIDGAELDTLTDEDLAQRLDRVAVFARVRPAQKLRIVAGYQRRGEVVAMTGDGVNDAPALVKADVGVAMGRTGTEVAKEAAKIVIADDNFASILAAVEEGRVVYRNIEKAVLLLLSTGVAEVFVLLMSLIMGLPAPFAAVQILWNNLVTEGLITVNLVMEPAEGDEMQSSPISPRQPLLHRVMLQRMVSMSLVIVLVTLGWYRTRIAAGVSLELARSETFTLLAVCEWFNVLNCRSSTRSALRLDLLRNPWLLGGLVLGNVLQVLVVFWRPLGELFYTVPFDLAVVLEIGALGSVVLWVEELRKWATRRASDLPRSSRAASAGSST